MKTVFLILAAAIICLTASCRKARTCTCDVNYEGVKKVRTVSAGLSFTNALVPFPITILEPSDITTSTPYSYETITVTDYDKISKSAAKQVCNSSEEEEINSSETTASVSSTVTVTDIGTRTSECSLD